MSGAQRTQGSVRPLPPTPPAPKKTIQPKGAAVSHPGSSYGNTQQEQIVGLGGAAARAIMPPLAPPPASNASRVIQEENSGIICFGPKIALVNNTGEVRDHQEDTALVAGSAGILMAVFDGMGGHNSGELASKKAAEVFQTEFLSADLFDFADAANKASAEVQSLVGGGSGTTLAGALIDPATGKGQIAHVGDSRVYLVKSNGTISLLTMDESYSVDAFSLQHSLVWPSTGLTGRALEEFYAFDVNFLLNNHIKQCIGKNENVIANVNDNVQLQPGERLLICSDGLNYLPLADIQKIVTGCIGKPSSTLVEQLADAVQPVSRDNYTILVYTQPELAPAAPAPAPAARAASLSEIPVHTPDILSSETTVRLPAAATPLHPIEAALYDGIKKLPILRYKQEAVDHAQSLIQAQLKAMNRGPLKKLAVRALGAFTTVILAPIAFLALVGPSLIPSAIIGTIVAIIPVIFVARSILRARAIRKMDADTLAVALVNQFKATEDSPDQAIILSLRKDSAADKAHYAKYSAIIGTGPAEGTAERSAQVLGDIAAHISFASNKIGCDRLIDPSQPIDFSSLYSVGSAPTPIDREFGVYAIAMRIIDSLGANTAPTDDTTKAELKNTLDALSILSSNPGDETQIIAPEPKLIPPAYLRRQEYAFIQIAAKQAYDLLTKGGLRLPQRPAGAPAEPNFNGTPTEFLAGLGQLEDGAFEPSNPIDRDDLITVLSSRKREFEPVNAKRIKDMIDYLNGFNWS